MNGSFAALMIALGVWDMGVNYCPTSGCLTPRTTDAYDSYSIHQNSVNDVATGNEIYFRRKTGHANGPFENAWGVSISEHGEMWAGFGHVYDIDTPISALDIQLHAMTGLYEKGQGTDLGGPIEFRSGIEVAYTFDNDWRLGAGWDHRSNLDIYSKNQGMESGFLRLSLPLR